MWAEETVENRLLDHGTAVRHLRMASEFADRAACVNMSVISIPKNMSVLNPDIAGIKKISDQKASIITHSKSFATLKVVHTEPFFLVCLTWLTGLCLQPNLNITIRRTGSSKSGRGKPTLHS